VICFQAKHPPLLHASLIIHHQGLQEEDSNRFVFFVFLLNIIHPSHLIAAVWIFRSALPPSERHELNAIVLFITNSTVIPSQDPLIPTMSIPHLISPVSSINYYRMKRFFSAFVSLFVAGYYIHYPPICHLHSSNHPLFLGIALMQIELLIRLNPAKYPPHFPNKRVSFLFVFRNELCPQQRDFFVRAMFTHKESSHSSFYLLEPVKVCESPDLSGSKHSSHSIQIQILIVSDPSMHLFRIPGTKIGKLTHGFTPNSDPLWML